MRYSQMINIMSFLQPILPTGSTTKYKHTNKWWRASPFPQMIKAASAEEPDTMERTHNPLRHIWHQGTPPTPHKCSFIHWDLPQRITGTPNMLWEEDRSEILSGWISLHYSKLNIYNKFIGPWDYWLSRNNIFII